MGEGNPVASRLLERICGKGDLFQSQRLSTRKISFRSVYNFPSYSDHVAGKPHRSQNYSTDNTFVCTTIRLVASCDSNDWFCLWGEACVVKGSFRLASLLQREYGHVCLSVRIWQHHRQRPYHECIHIRHVYSETTNCWLPQAQANPALIADCDSTDSCLARCCCVVYRPPSAQQVIVFVNGNSSERKPRWKRL